MCREKLGKPTFLIVMVVAPKYECSISPDEDITIVFDVGLARKVGEWWSDWITM